MDLGRSLDLYAWHAELSAACFHLISHFEVLVRNAVDRELSVGQPQSPLKDTWLMDFDVLRPDGVKQVITAVERLEKGRQVTRARVVAGLSFGFWTAIFGPPYEELWRHRLRRAFPSGASLKRNDVVKPMQSLRKFRNRVAHHDCILQHKVVDRREEMLRVAGWIAPEARTWLETSTRVDEILRRRPASLVVSQRP